MAAIDIYFGIGDSISYYCNEDGNIKNFYLNSYNKAVEKIENISSSFLIYYIFEKDISELDIQYDEDGKQEVKYNYNSRNLRIVFWNRGDEVHINEIPYGGGKVQKYFKEKIKRELNNDFSEFNMDRCMDVCEEYISQKIPKFTELVKTRLRSEDQKSEDEYDNSDNDADTVTEDLKDMIKQRFNVEGNIEEENI
jgi:hypothetical protein